jgi:serine/threonine-protein kinase
LLRIATVREDEHLLACADLWAHKAATAAPPEGGAFREGAAFGRFVEARVAAARGDEAALPAALERFVASSSTDYGDFDVFSGCAGTLLACAILLDALPLAGADEARALLGAHGEGLASRVYLGMGADPEASTIAALGAAHGVAGMLFSVLRWHEATGRPLAANLDAWLRWLAAKAIPVGRGMFWPTETGAPLSDRTLAASWCNGAAGYVALWTLADRLAADRWADHAEAAAWFAWEDVGVVPDLCCGLAGRGYAMLSLYRHTGEPAWLGRSRQLAARAAHHVRDSLQPRDSLFHGELGLATLIADIQRPEFGGMPLYEAEA